MTAKKLNQRQARWSLLLARFDFLLHHQPRKTMGKSDALSCRSDHGSGMDDNKNLTLLTPSLFVVRIAVNWQGEGYPEGDKVRNAGRRSGRGHHNSGQGTFSSEWSMENCLLYYRGKVYVPGSKLCCRILALCHDSKLAGHPGRWKTLELVRGGAEQPPKAAARLHPEGQSPTVTRISGIVNARDSATTQRIRSWNWSRGINKCPGT